MVKKAVLPMLLFIVIMSIPIGYLGCAFHHLDVIKGEFEASTNIARLFGKTENQVIELLGEPYIRNRKEEPQAFIEYKSHGGEYAHISLSDGRVVAVNYYWQ